MQNKRGNNSHYELLLQMNDEDLMMQFQAGTLDAFNILVDRYSERLKNYLFGFVRDIDKCQDLIQETFVRVYRNRHSYRCVAKYSTWLYTIAGNLARSEYRKRKHRRMCSLQSLSSENEAYEMEIPDETYSPEEFTEGMLQDHYFQEALKQVPEAFREVVVLRDVQQLSYEEIAQITGLPMGTVKSRINRGRAHLQTLLKDIYMPQDN